MKYTEEYLTKYGIKSVMMISEDTFAPRLLFSHFNGFQKSYKLNTNLVQDIRNSPFSDSIVENLIDNHIVRYMRKIKLDNINEI